MNLSDERQNLLFAIKFTALGSRVGNQKRLMSCFWLLGREALFAEYPNPPSAFSIMT
jgi:hypothetical protein